MSSPDRTEERQLRVKLADNADDLRAAQRLRYQVFVEELGATGPGVDHDSRLETDDFDGFCDHLLLVDDSRSHTQGSHVIGAYRLLRSEVALKESGFYSADEYDLSPLLNSGRSLLELGRSCVHPDYRRGAAMMKLWNALAEYVVKHGVEVMFGVASYHGTDVAPLRQSLAYLHHNHLAPEHLRVRVKDPHYQTLNLLDVSEIDKRQALLETPALIKGYLRLGGVIGDGAYIDRAFNTVDVCLIMDTLLMSERHRNVYQKRGETLGRIA